ncbi:YciI family protein [Wukongibacter baidiensis]|uniref:YciI family protein n=1 Tax=Wukongibacter baidiensis TaxID=1723361 RepID=UPI003D7F7D07
MKKGDKLFIRIDHRIEENEFGSKDYDDHIEYLQGIASERFFLGGGFVNQTGGMIIYKAKNIEEAHLIAKKDPLILRNLYSYELVEWNLVIVSDLAK